MGECHRPGGYYLRGADRIPGDAAGKPIPEAEWLDADYERIKGHPRHPANAGPQSASDGVAKQKASR